MNMSVIYITQSFMELPKMLKQNFSHIIIYKLKDNDDAYRILRRYGEGKIDDNKKIYHGATCDPYNFMLIDGATKKTYEHIRRGSSFDDIIRNLRLVSENMVDSRYPANNKEIARPKALFLRFERTVNDSNLHYESFDRNLTWGGIRIHWQKSSL